MSVKFNALDFNRIVFYITSFLLFMRSMGILRAYCDYDFYSIFPNERMSRLKNLFLYIDFSVICCKVLSEIKVRKNLS